MMFHFKDKNSPFDVFVVVVVVVFDPAFEFLVFFGCACLDTVFY